MLFHAFVYIEFGGKVVMFDSKHYFPVIKWKRGEKKALKNLDSTLKNQFTPIIELQALKEESRYSSEEQIDKYIEDINNIFKDQFYVIIDPTEILVEENYVNYLYERMKEFNIKFIPVMQTNWSNNDNLNSSQYKERGICLRLNQKDLNDDNWGNNLDSFINKYHLSYDEIFLVLDLEDISKINETTIKFMIKQFLNELPEIDSWKQIVFIGASFPESMRGIDPNAITVLPRIEWKVWKEFYNNKYQRVPNFGDYIIQSPFLITDFDPVTMQISAKIKYTSGDNFIICKGTSLRGESGYGQYRDLCKLLIESPYYYSQNHSYGCKYIYDCSEGNVSTGNPETWVVVGINHHLTLACQQLSALPVLSTSS
jgi:hypothetical protein